MKALRNFLSLVADQLGGTLRTRGGNIELKLPRRLPVIIDLAKDASKVSKERLMFVEKQAAIALMSEPTSFSVTVKDDAWRRNRRVTLLRVAFGYYIINGARCFQRYTAYYDTQNAVVAVLLGNDNLFSPTTKTVNSEYNLSQFNTAGPTLASLVQSVYQHFIKGDRQIREFKAIADHQSDRIFELGLLYERRSKQHIRTFGVDLNDLKSRPPSASDEFHRRRLDILSRHIPRVALKILSTGIVVSPAKGRKKSILMPFIPKPKDKRWIVPWQDELKK